jgi:hypothetical protein
MTWRARLSVLSLLDASASVSSVVLRLSTARNYFTSITSLFQQRRRKRSAVAEWRALKRCWHSVTWSPSTARYTRRHGDFSTRISSTR